MQTILGAGGAIGTELAKALQPYTNKIRLVSRNPERLNETDELMLADLRQPEAVDRAVAGSKVVYLVAGLEYKLRVWDKTWPTLMRNVLEACKKHGARLVFFDNVYMYDPGHLPHMTEESPINPVSRKGAIRASIAQMLMQEVKSGNLTALIARSADFIGPKNSVLVEMVYKKLNKDKKASWFADASRIHSFTFTPDAARATALLGNTPDAYNQVWHLPTDPTPLTGEQWIKLFAREMQAAPKFRVFPAWQVGLLGIFVPILKELKEMLYQYNRDYFFDSSKFEKRFGIKATPPAESVKWVVQEMELYG